jgi:hypothetical protein
VLHAQAGLDIETPERVPIDPAAIHYLGGVPRYLFRTALGPLRKAVAARLAFDSARSFEHELWLCFFAGVVHQRWRDRHAPVAPMSDALLSNGTTLVR